MTIEIPEMILLANTINQLFAGRVLMGVRRWVDTEVGVNEAGKKRYESRHEDLHDYASTTEPSPAARIRAREAGRALILEVISADESNPVSFGAYVIKFGLKGWMGAVDTSLAVVDSNSVLKPVATRQRVAIAPLLVAAPSSTSVSRWKHVRASLRFSDQSTLRVMDDSRSAEIRWVPATSVDGGVATVPPSELPRSIGSISTPEELTALVRGIAHETPTTKTTLVSAIMKRPWSYGLGEVTICEWFHRARVSPYVSVADASKNDETIVALGNALHDTIQDRVRGVELAIYGIVDKSKNIGAVKNVYYNKESCLFVESEAPKERRKNSDNKRDDEEQKQQEPRARKRAAAAAAADDDAPKKPTRARAAARSGQGRKRARAFSDAAGDDADDTRA